jgi:outer membrane protein assembly factor BamB
MKRFLPAFLIAVSCCFAQSWRQWGGNPQHTGSVNVAGQPALRLLAEEIHDQFSSLEQAESGGSLLAHYQPPLLDGRDVFLAVKGGSYISCNPPGSGRPDPCGAEAWNFQTWGMQSYRWVNGNLRTRWWFDSDWQAPPNGRGGLSGWEPVFHAAVTDQFVLVPAAGGDVTVLRRNNGNLVRRIQPFGETIDKNKYVVSPLTVDNDGNLIYNVMQLDPADPWAFDRTDIPDAWLVKVTPRGAVTKVSYKTLIPDAPTSCKLTFIALELPWPASPTAVPPSAPCLSQRPGVNMAPAAAPDGTIYTVSRAHGNSRYSYLVALNPDLTLKWAASLRDRLRDGCGVSIPVGIFGGCRNGTPATGVEPATNDLPAGMVSDISTSSPVVAPDGSILYGAQTGYNYLRGHLFHFDNAGEFLNAFDFGWDTTPAVWEHDGTYSVILKENNYPVGNYCFDGRFCPAQPNGPYYITQLGPDLKVQWRFQNTSTEECERQPDGSLSCRPARAGGFEWCINAPAVDVHGNVYANAEDGHVYVIGQGGKLLQKFFLHLALGAAYTPLSIGFDGLIYTMNDGKMFVVGK